MKTMQIKSLLPFFILFSFSFNLYAQKRALVIGIDGLKSTELHRCMFEKNMAPNMLRLTQNGLNAECPHVLSDTCARAHDGQRFGIVYKWMTGPGWGAVIAGINTAKHQIRNNTHRKLSIFYEVTKNFPTMFKIAKHAGLETVIGGVGSFLTSYKGLSIYPGVVDYECGLGEKGPAVGVLDSSSCNASYRLSLHSDSNTRDEELTDFLIDRIKNTNAQLIMGVLDQVDETGHKHGFSDNEEYLNAIELADELVARLVAATLETNDEWLYIVASDHGGHKNGPLPGGAHGHILFHDEVVPFIMSLSSKTTLLPLKYPVRHMDVNPTVLHWLDLKPAENIDGRVQGF